jgi:hypothetical protein
MVSQIFFGNYERVCLRAIALISVSCLSCFFFRGTVQFNPLSELHLLFNTVYDTPN